MRRREEKEAGELVFSRGTIADYERFAALHYRAERPAFVSDVFVLKGIKGEDAGMVTYSYAPANCAARNRVFVELPAGRSERLRAVNELFRIVSRVILLPEYRGCGLAAMLLRQSAGFVDAACIEALSASEAGAKLFERAGFTRSECPESPQKKRLIKLLGECGMPLALREGERRRSIYGELPEAKRQEIYKAAGAVLGAYGRLREIEEPAQRLEEAVRKLHCNPAYFYLVRKATRRQDA